jgi:hypothetical protein
MSFKSKDGKSFGSAYVAKKKDAMHAGATEPSTSMGPKDTTRDTEAPEKAAVPAEESRTNDEGAAKVSAKEATAPDNDVLANPEGVDAGAVVAEHGPASSVTTHHDHQSGKHVVISRHPSGHMNMSQHKSHGEAHEAAKQLSGPANEENTDKNPNADAGQGDMYGGGENDGFKMPGLG